MAGRQQAAGQGARRHRGSPHPTIPSSQPPPNPPLPDGTPSQHRQAAVRSSSAASSSSTGCKNRAVLQCMFLILHLFLFRSMLCLWPFAAFRLDLKHTW
ncbi:hypothetical protein BDA96_03G197900 [Sorghum bicolor]|uniref:Uncharacterized protein n=2 Tax=Sorghum bicolor TaxID=4558 RepID=A0A921UN99_SORBI|nr:hypothetical protein BDA96_03G197900 [Sorghum bicolor]OQU86973.1 hypothetical protein SORBI_3003G182901 [Sorghum bicolor]